MLLFHNNRGFTLVELMVVGAIVGILGVVAFASFGTWFASNRIEGAGSQLLAEMNLARMKAISENNDYSIEFDLSSHDYSIYDNGVLVKTIDINENFQDIEFDYGNADKETDNTTNLSGNAVSFAGTPPTVTFKPTGLSNSGTVYLNPKDETKFSLLRAINVNIAGRIKLYTHNGTSWE